ncbi:MAG: AmmeMemoRadiSam system protein B [Kiritimatiellae bacterium]|nr:AmmeMemoRadiSam system protein B [Kiritimatiellia bacterium]
MSEECPKLRSDLEIIPGMLRGQQVFIIRDHLGLIKEPLAFAQDAFGLMRMLDGTHTLREIELDLTRRRGGVLLANDEVQRVLERFDAAFLLDNDRYRQARKRLLDAFDALPVRAASHAGAAYPNDPRELRRRLDAILKAGPEPGPLEPEKIVALAAPHIDLAVGEPQYAAAYGALRQTPPPDLVVLLGTGHTIEDGVFCLTEKDFETPLGTARTEKRLVRELRKAAGPAASSNEFAHRREHSLEFQIIFLQHLFGPDTFRIVPILCGSFADYLDGTDAPSEVAHAKDVLSLLRKAVADKAQRVLVVAGVDLAHVGPKFGDEMQARALVAESGPHDQALLNALCRLDVKAFWAEARRVGDRYHVCGFSALACMTEILPKCRGRVLDYHVWHEEPTHSAVSFAAVLFEKS